MSSSTESAAPAAQSRTNVFINYLPCHVGAEEFANLVSGFGPRRSVYLSPPKTSVYIAPMNNLQLNGGYGFVRFVFPDDATKCVQVLDGLFMYHKQLKVSFARASGGHTIQIWNLDRAINDAGLHSLLREFGTVISARVIYERCMSHSADSQLYHHRWLPQKTGLSTGEAYAIYETKEQAVCAAQHLRERFGCTVTLFAKSVGSGGRRGEVSFIPALSISR